MEPKPGNKTRFIDFTSIAFAVLAIGLPALAIIVS